MTRREQTLRLAILDMARLTLTEEGVEVRPLTLREIEEISGVSRSTAFNIEHDALTKLRRKIGELENPQTNP